MGFLITFKSVTHAKSGESILAKNGIPTYLIRPATVISRGSCGYALRLNAIGAQKAVQLLREKRVPYGGTFFEEPGGEIKEVRM